jgi:RNA polymerase sigma-70 factor (ECF subfamily)
MNALSDPIDRTDLDLAQDRETQTAERESRRRAVLEEMADRHGRFVYRVAYALVRNAADAEDVAQETFLQVLRGSPERTIADERGYLARVAWRLAVRRCRFPLPHERSEELLREVKAPGHSPEEAALQGDLENWLHCRIGELPEKLRQPLALAALGELKLVEIAQILGLPEGTVRRRIHTARQKLKEQLKSRNGGNR